ncbi:MAG: hypothetical protein AB7O49_19630 [Sphingomonadales bacterium]
MPESSSSEAGGAKGGPAKWWQWVIIYPTLAISILSAAPQWVDKGQALFNGVEDRGWEEAKQQQEAWRSNLTCSAAPFDWYSTAENLKVDATICNSGDIFVRVSTPSQGNFYRWVLLKSIVKDKETAALPSLIPKAFAGPATTGLTEGRYTVASAEAATVICQAFLPDGRTLKRHVSTAAGCFDEYVDTYTGQVTRREQVECRTSC